MIPLESLNHSVVAAGLSEILLDRVQFRQTGRVHDSHESSIFRSNDFKSIESSACVIAALVLAHLVAIHQPWLDDSFGLKSVAPIIQFHSLGTFSIGCV